MLYFLPGILIGLVIGIIGTLLFGIEKRYTRAILKLWSKYKSIQMKLYYSEKEKDLLASMLLRHQMALDIENKIAYRADQKQSIQSVDFMDEQDANRKKGWRKG